MIRTTKTIPAAALLLCTSALASQAAAFEPCSSEHFEGELRWSASHLANRSEALAVLEFKPEVTSIGDVLAGDPGVYRMMVLLGRESVDGEKKEFISAGIRFTSDVDAFVDQPMTVRYIVDGEPAEATATGSLPSADALYAWDTVRSDDAALIAWLKEADSLRLSATLPDGSVVESGELAPVLGGYRASLDDLLGFTEQAAAGTCETSVAPPPPPPL